MSKRERERSHLYQLIFSACVAYIGVLNMIKVNDIVFFLNWYSPKSTNAYIQIIKVTSKLFRY